MTSKQSPCSEMHLMRYVREGDWQARHARLIAVIDEVSRALHAHNRQAMAGRVRIECRDKLLNALEQDRAVLSDTAQQETDDG